MPVSVTTLEGEPLSLSKLGSYHRFSKSDPSLNESIDREEEVSIGAATPTEHSLAQASLSFIPSSLPPARSISINDPNAGSSNLRLSRRDATKKVDMSTQTDEKTSPAFRPLLLFIPLRLGQDKFNMEYADALKACFAVPQTVGVVGGRPRHALWLIGYNGT